MRAHSARIRRFFGFGRTDFYFYDADGRQCLESISAWAVSAGKQVNVMCIPRQTYHS